MNTQVQEAIARGKAAFDAKELMEKERRAKAEKQWVAKFQEWCSKTILEHIAEATSKGENKCVLSSNGKYVYLREADRDGGIYLLLPDDSCHVGLLKKQLDELGLTVEREKESSRIYIRWDAPQSTEGDSHVS